MEGRHKHVTACEPVGQQALSEGKASAGVAHAVAPRAAADVSHNRLDAGHAEKEAATPEQKGGG